MGSTPFGHRQYPRHTKLGRLMYERGLRAIDMTVGADIYPRTMTEYLAGRKRPSSRSLVRLTTFLKVKPEAILEKKYPWLPEDQLVKEALESMRDELASDVESEPNSAKEVAQ